ncbi:MAG: alpha-dehydro-beta-deoxy-D-glucarate aldolase [Rhodococcus erythropolis]|jgi:4-hydroxy-2-oxoheptanedioate aldolase|uniref:HpcH/HpaI aldolase/citrate lyase family protein n=2 Tax=Rhodococcus erythropolis TaxID=1833 RepID=A0AAX3ZYI1_RHOER|nr:MULTISPECIES: HpcH/HpaI aldolase/citrate lyase family protein [Rhodococcus]AKD96213.1 alpha-dehydro-beta-deoxy-D-glucarate aldolase [Rhodococcus erythropolis]EQM32564.1 hypothetical protein N601_16235 [Rhodococcus erythropolis DN1]MCS4252827.1 4-hydroxy-2-oxoheptanedioate aldolase [Rhodococcus erythropolis]MCW2299392.1 4-hydroxy-2-oxoheptanedioate aldolase [Rhodococcus erythropolis]MCW2428729.1 4-hydroxy-2-oxoheptanedioate aldolase [Rhodococcus erythropolis]
MTTKPFKVALRSDTAPALGLWLGLGEAVTAEICAGAGFDWVLIDSEHGPNDLRSVADQLRAVAADAVEPIVRPPSTDAVDIKRLLDIGVRTLLLPMVESGSAARDAVAATRYPPFGNRGVGSALARASRWNRDVDYLENSADGITLIAQIETPGAVANIGDIAGTAGIDAVFVGLSDLAATSGHLGQPLHPQVQEAFRFVVDECTRIGVPVGTLAGSDAVADFAIGLGCRFVAIGTDVAVLVRGCETLLERYRAPKATRGVEVSVY